MGFLIILVLWLALLTGVMLLPRLSTFIDDYIPEYFPADMSDWELLEAIVLMMPFIFLLFVLYGAFRWVTKM